MTIYVGEAVRIRSVITDPDTGEVIGDPAPSSVVVSFWSPGRNPIRNASIRNAPDKGPFTLDFRVDEKDWVAYVDTTGWAAGKWSFRVTVTRSGRLNWEYATLTLKP